MSSAAVRIILPCYNRRSTLPRAVDSVRAQTFSDWDLVIVDDGSTDDTPEWLAELQKNWTSPQRLEIRTLSNGGKSASSNSGVSRARNEGAKGCQAVWLAFLDSDDEWLPHKLSVQMKMAESSSFPLIHGEEIWIRNGVRVNPKAKYKKSGGAIFEKCVDHCCISVTTTMIRTSVFDELGGFREDFKVCEDYELWLRISAAASLGFVEEPVAIKYGGHADQLSTQFHSMDADRVRALLPFLESKQISAEQRQYVARNIVTRSEILLAGLEKRQNAPISAFSKDQVLGWRESAQKTLETESTLFGKPV